MHGSTGQLERGGGIALYACPDSLSSHHRSVTEERRGRSNPNMMKHQIVILLACASALTLQLTAQEPIDANGWEQLGIAQQSKGQYKDAAASFQKALDRGYGPMGKYNLACALARLGEGEKALALLQELSQAGIGPLPLTTDSDLESLRAEPRFQTLVQKARQSSEPCLFPDKHPEYRQLDFWVGNWDVFAPGGAKVGESHVDLILKNCVVFENWTGLAGGSGKSLNKYDPQSGKWEQFWVADSGGTTYFTGESVDGEMRYVHEHKLKDGQTLLRHMTFSKLSGGKVRQFSQRSMDGGKTWITDYDFTYVPKKS